MSRVWGVLGAVLVLVILWVIGITYYEESVLVPEAKPDSLPFLETNQLLITPNTTRVGSDDPIETAVAVSQIIYPATEEDNVPGAVILVNRENIAEVMVANSRVQHFPVNAPILYVDEDSIPSLTRNELLRLEPAGVAFDENTQVYLVGTIGESVVQEVRELGFRTRVLTAENPILLAEVVDTWTSTQHGDHRNDVVIANLDNLEPALASAFWNAHEGDALAFVTNEGIPDATRRILSRRANGPWMYVFGDDTVISDEIVRELGQYSLVTRLPRGDLPSMSAFFAGFHDQGANWGAWVIQDARSFGWGLAEAGHNAIFVNLDGPGGWQNVLCATTLSHMGKHAPVLAVNVDEVPDVIASYLDLLESYPTAAQEQILNHGWIIGGVDTISWETQVALDGMLETYPRVPAPGEQ